MKEKGINKSEVVALLQSGHQERISETIAMLREHGDSSSLPEVIQVLNDTQDPFVVKSILGLLADVKRTDAIPYIIDGIKHAPNAELQRNLVSICWENGMDFCSHISLFVDLVLKRDFLVAFEAFTVIENMEGVVDDAEKQRLVSLIESQLVDVSPEKEGLLLDLIQIIPNIKPAESYES
ncbi:HEAT repeat domain-containing protein [Halosquirtibacter xylanolyticus]|uniref:hypothetical protein n=1 Tax=Halosquirtibacter xylanolyticus TaxID=3374599 RepID=UPI00374A9215|nr:HEAT repeat domain-containing protein [Prolixibacteraceae bacterium]